MTYYNQYILLVFIQTETSLKVCSSGKKLTTAPQLVKKYPFKTFDTEAILATVNVEVFRMQISFCKDMYGTDVEFS